MWCLIVSSHTAFNHYEATHVMCLLWNKRLGFSHHGALPIFCSETTSYWTSMQSFGRTILHYEGWLLPFFIINFVSRLSETFLHPFQKKRAKFKMSDLPLKMSSKALNYVSWKCFFKSSFCLNVVPHCEQAYCFQPLWSNTCCVLALKQQVTWYACKVLEGQS